MSNFQDDLLLRGICLQLQGKKKNLLKNDHQHHTDFFITKFAYKKRLFVESSSSSFYIYYKTSIIDDKVFLE